MGPKKRNETKAETSSGRPVSTIERIVSLLLLGALVAFFGFLVTRGPYYSTSDEVPVGRAEKERPGGGGADDPAREELLPEAIPGIEWVRDGEVEVYPEDRLFEKINGADERYKAYGNTRLVYASYVPKGNVDNRLDVYLFEMRTPLAALGIFGKERSPGAEIDRNLGGAGYFVEGSAYFRSGRYYVKLEGSSAEAAERLARFLVEKLPVTPAPETAFTFLPQENRIAGSERYEPKDSVLGTDFLEHVFSAEYLIGEGGSLAPPLILFAVNCGDEESAREEAERYYEHLQGQGKLLKLEEIEGVVVTLMDLDGLFDAYYVEGSVLAGVAEAPDQTTLRRFVGALIRTLRAGVVPRVGESSSVPSPPVGR
jgi:hypothetical protein